MVQLELKSYSTTFRPKVNIINVHETHHIPIVLWQCYTWNDFHASTLKCAKMCTPSRMDVQSPFATTAIQFCWVSAGCVLKLLNLWRYKTRKNKFCLFATAALHRLGSPDWGEGCLRIKDYLTVQLNSVCEMIT